jgi:23S rRNA pseudouridine1911/1915/1917 synthase
MDSKNTEYCLIHSISSVEDFLKIQFNASGNKLKKYFEKSFLNRSFNAKATLELPINFINDGEINPHYVGGPIELIFEDESFFVFNKNCNQFIHPLTYDESDNCLSYIREFRPELLKVNDKNYDRGLLYRLDYETSGVVIYLKTNELYQKLRDNFSSIAKEKKYLCWVHGEFKQTETFVHYFQSREEKRKKIIVNNAGEGTSGELSTTPLRFDSENNITLVEVILKTGLRHQIRAQMSHLGFPLVGDTFYGGKSAIRLYLHALNYTLFIDGQSYSWESKPFNFNGL